MNERLRPLLLVSILAFGPGIAWAERPAAHGSQGQASDSVSRVERQAGGQVIRAESMQRDGREVTRYKVLTADGRVRVVQDDPQDRDRRQAAPRPAHGEPDRPRDEDSDPFP